MEQEANVVEQEAKTGAEKAKPGTGEANVEAILPKAELFKMTAMQRIYFEGRARGLRPVDAARAAGSESPSDYASLMEKHPRLRLLMKEMNEHLMKKTALTREDVINGLQDAIHAAETAGEMVAGWREIGKILGVYAPEVVEHRKGPKTRDMKVMSDDELLELAETENHRLTEDDKVVSVSVEEPVDAEYTEITATDSHAESEEVVQDKDDITMDGLVKDD